MDAEEIYRLMKDPDSFIKKFFRSQKFCMAYSKSDCRGKIAQAHTISKKFLKHITEKGQAYYVNASSHVPNLYKFNLTGLKKLTPFSGFCQHHDNILFQSFEKNDFDEKNKTQIYDMTFRILCREFFYKKCMLSFYETKVSEMDVTGFSNSEMFRDYKAHVSREVEEHTFLYEKYLQIKNVHYVIFKTERIPIATAGILFPRYDLDGNEIQDSAQFQHGFVFSVFPTKRNTYIIIATVNSSKRRIVTKFLNSIYTQPDSVLIDSLFSVFFHKFDNIVLGKVWYESLTDEIKNALSKLLIQNSSHYFDETHGIIFNFTKLFNINKLDRIKKY